MVNKKNNNFHPSILFALLFWLVFFYLIIFVDPLVVRDFPFQNMYFPFFFCLFMGAFLSLQLILSHARRGFITAFGLVLFLYLRLFGLGHVLNLILLSSFIITLELAISSHR